MNGDVRVGECVLCHGKLGEFGREVYMRSGNTFHIIGYACRGCTELRLEALEPKQAESQELPWWNRD